MEPIEYPIDGTLDLHQFHPREIKELVTDYLELCQQKGILKVRVVHGKGTGTLRTTVHALLSKLPIVSSFHLAEDSAGSWGATWVHLKPKP